MDAHPMLILGSSIVLSSLVVAAGALVGCGSSSPPAPTSTAAAVAGPVDMHCTDNGVEIKQAIGMCVVDNGGGAGGGADDGGTDDGGNNGGSDFGPTLYNAEGDDDDCKYHVRWTSTAVKENVGVTFDVNVTRRTDGKPATGGNVQIEVYIGNRPTPSVDIPNTESAGGNYKVGPVIFDAPGIWTVRFHVYETCSDEPADSPHGHAAFLVDVP